MPTHCCVPLCTKKDKRDQDTGEKISFFRFPDDVNLRKQWLHAIRRDVGPNFSIKEGTRVCLRHFKAEDLKRSLNNKVSPKPGAVPSIFAWKRSSPRKRPPPTPHFTATTVANNLESEFSEVMHSVNESSKAVGNNSSQTNMAGATSVPETVEIEPPHREYNSDFLEKSEKDLLISELQEKLSALHAKNEELEDLVLKLKKKVADLEQKYEQLEEQLFSLKNIGSNDSLVAFYTGFPNYQTMMALYDYLDPGARGENIKYWLSGKDTSGSAKAVKQGRPRSLKPVDEFFLALCRLRQGFAELHLAHLFNVSQPTVSRVFISWINYMYLKLGHINIWPSRELVDETMPQDFKAKYPSTRVIIDCTEVRCEMPSSLLLNSELFSTYKHHTTLKALVGISPKGFFTFIGQLYTGSISDREIVERSGFLNLPFSNGDSVMADKGFTIEDILPLGVSLNIPPFLEMSDQMSAEDVIVTQEIASLRIHVERAINKVKNFLIFDGVIPLSLFGVVNQMWCVCAILCNMQDPIISA